MKRNTKSLAAAVSLCAAWLLSSCMGTGTSKVEYVPFQETEDGQWGMVSMDGKVLFEDEFKTQPTLVRDGRFFVKTKGGSWEMYEAAEKPKSVGGTYAHVSSFQGGRALVAEKGKPVSIINTDGKEVKLLDKIEGKEVHGVRTFSEGYAIFMTTDSLWGAIDASGKCVVKPEYIEMADCGDGKFLCVDKKYKKDIQRGDRKKTKMSVVNTSGKELFTFSYDKYENFYKQFEDGKLAVSVKKDGKERWGLIDAEGNEVVKPSNKIKRIGDIRGDKFTYSNGEGWGLMSTEGETLIRAKYEYLYYDKDNLLLAVVKEGDSYEYKYIDEKDNKIGDDAFVQATLFSQFDGEHAFVKSDDKSWVIIGNDCKELKGLPDMVDIGLEDGESYIESDYVDFEKLVAAFDIRIDGALGITFKNTPQSVVAMSVKDGSAPSNDEHKAGDPWWYDVRSGISFMKNVNGVLGTVDVYFGGILSHQNYRTNRVIDYTYGDWYWYHDEKVPTGYTWNNVKPQTFTFTVSNEGRMKGKLRQLHTVLIEKFKKMGKIVKQNNGAAVFELRDGHRAVVAMTKTSVFAQWGNLASVGNIDIDQYKDVSEEDEDESYGGSTPDFGSGDYEYADSAAVDTVVGW